MTLRAFPIHARPSAPPTLSERIQTLQDEARGLAQDHVNAFIKALREIERMGNDIAKGGEAYPVGVREIAARLAEDCAPKALSISVLMERR